MPVSDILKVEGWKGALRWPSTNLQNLLVCTVPPKQRLSSNLPDLVSFDPDWSAILIRSRLISMADDQSNPKWNSVLGHLFLPLTFCDGQIGDFRMVLLCKSQVLLESSNRMQQKLFYSSQPIKSSNEGMKNSLNLGSWIKWFWILAMKS